jgi:type IV pilus assembly protein PilA
MKSFKRGEKGFTLIELLIVVAILGVLAAVVIPNVVGLMGRGGKQAYQTDSEVIQLATSTFFSDVHSGFDSANVGQEWGDSDVTISKHYYPCALAGQSQPYLVLGLAGGDDTNPTNQVILGASGNATDTEINAHAIWMGLLVNAPGEVGGTASGGVPDRLAVSVQGNDTGLYLQKMPKSANELNGALSGKGGGYAWVVGKNGTVYGVYQPIAEIDSPWYVGFGGAYP